MNKGETTMNVKSLGQVMVIWGETKSVRNARLVNLLKTVFKVYILPNLSYEFASQLSSSEFSTLCYDIEIINLEPEKVLKIFDEAFDARVKAGEVSAQTKRNYRSALGKFFTWLQTQSWFIEQIEPPNQKLDLRKLIRSEDQREHTVVRGSMDLKKKN
jgi:hypothetical protein